MKTLWMVGLFAAFAAAQNRVCITGVVMPVGGPTICMQGETHRLADTTVFLRSTNVNLGHYTGQLVRLDGVDVSLLCRVLDVQSVTPPFAALDHCGTPMPGCAIKLRVGPGAIGRWALAVAFGPGYLPLGCTPPDWLDGTWLLGPSAITLAVAPFTGQYGEYVVALPNDPSLAGLPLWFQGARQDIGPVGPIEFTNLLHLQLVPFLPPCGGLNC